MFTVNWDPIKYSGRQFALWRIAFGLYLTYYFSAMIPFGTEVYSREGSQRFFPLLRHSFYPEALLRFNSALEVKAILLSCALLSILIMLGCFRRCAALLLWLLIVWLYNQAPYADSPEQEFVNWLVLALTLIPSGEVLSIGRKNRGWFMPKHIYWAAWIILCLGYFYAGAGKFRDHDPSWMNGSAMYYVLTTDNGRMAWYGNLFEHFPRAFFIALTYGALFTQTFAGLFVIFRRTRPWWWLVATLTHLGLLFFVHLAQVTLGMLLFHLFVFDSDWAMAIWRAARRFMASNSRSFRRPPYRRGPRQSG